MSTRKYISIIGSQSERTASESERALTREDARHIGQVLAARDYGIMVYACDSHKEDEDAGDPQENKEYIEDSVVDGFVAHCASYKGMKHRFRKSIQLWCQHMSLDTLHSIYKGKAKEHEDLFDLRPDFLSSSSNTWRIPFFRSLSQADGMIVLGGAQLSLAAGVTALTHNLPLVAIKETQGRASTLWIELSEGRGLATRLGADAMERHCHGDDKIVEKWIDSLESQAKAAEKIGPQIDLPHPHWWLWTFTCLLACIALLCVGYYGAGKTAAVVATQPALTTQPALAWTQSEHWQMLFYLTVFIAPVFSSALGGWIRLCLEPPVRTDPRRVPLMAAAAGLVVSLLYLIGTYMSVPGSSWIPQAPTFGMLVIVETLGFVAGVTFDKVYAKLQSLDVIHAQVLNKAAWPNYAPGSKRGKRKYSP